jgi:hypothetical protein
MLVVTIAARPRLTLRSDGSASGPADCRADCGPATAAQCSADDAPSDSEAADRKFPRSWPSDLASRLCPHWHPDEWRTAVVLSGTLYFGVGEQWDESKLKAYPAGTSYSEPPKTPHFVWAKDGEVILQTTGMGPTGSTPIPQK